jgi:hypothetical protein
MRIAGSGSLLNVFSACESMSPSKVRKATLYQPPQPRSQWLTIIAQDPGVRFGCGKNRRMPLANVELPAEVLAPGPRGYRVQVVDYDASSDKLWIPAVYSMSNDFVVGPFANASYPELLSDPRFHQQGVYALATTDWYPPFPRWPAHTGPFRPTPTCRDGVSSRL